MFAERNAAHHVRHRNRDSACEAVAAMQEAGWEIPRVALNGSTTPIFSEDLEAEHIAEAVESTPDQRRAPAGSAGGPTAIPCGSPRARNGRAAFSIPPTAMPMSFPTTWKVNERGGSGPFLIVPYTLDANDMRFATPQGFNSGDQFFSYSRTVSDPAPCRQSGAEMMIGLHCRLVGRPGRAAALAPASTSSRTRKRLGGDTA